MFQLITSAPRAPQRREASPPRARAQWLILYFSQPWIINSSSRRLTSRSKRKPSRSVVHERVCGGSGGFEWKLTAGSGAVSGVWLSERNVSRCDREWAQRQWGGSSQSSARQTREQPANNALPYKQALNARRSRKCCYRNTSTISKRKKKKIGQKIQIKRNYKYFWLCLSWDRSFLNLEKPRTVYF